MFFTHKNTILNFTLKIIRNIYANSHFYLFAPKKMAGGYVILFYTILVFTTIFLYSYMLDLKK